VKKYSLKFTKLSRYGPTTIVASRTKISKFVSYVCKILVKECHTAMLVNDMDISHLMVHAQQIEEEKRKERSREAKRAKTRDGNLLNSRLDGYGRSKF